MIFYYRLHCLIWTTTPWTLPCNQAVAFNKDLLYCVVENGEDIYLVASNLVESLSKTFNTTLKVLDTFSGNTF